MEEKLVSYNVAKLAKEVGFNVVTEYRFFYNSELTTKTPSQSSKPTIYAPTQSLLQKWIREVHNIDISVSPSLVKWYYYTIYLNKICMDDNEQPFETYEQAIEQAILGSLKLIKDEKI